MGKPNIRFKGYTEDWEQRKLGDFGKATGGTSIESEFSEDGIYKVISIGSYSENSVYNDQGIRAIKSDKTSNRVLNRNDLTMILNDKTTSGNIIGRVLLIEESGIYVYNQRTERIEINLDEYDPVFLYEMLNAPNIREKIIKQAQGNTQIYVNWTAISLLEYMIPSKEEQVKIGEYLHSISNLITLHQRKYDETKKLKKCMLQKMFPKDGEKVPEIRFSGFTGDWKQRKLGDVFKEYSEKNHAEQPALTIMQGEGTIKREDSERNLLYNKSNLSSYKMVYQDDFIVHLRSFEGGLEKASCNGIVSPAYHIFHGEKADSRFYYSYFRSYEFIKRKLVPHIYGIRDGRSIDIAGMKTIDIPYPSFEEQRRIGDYLDSVNNLITFHQQKCDELKNIKKFMLQNMFVSEK